MTRSLPSARRGDELALRLSALGERLGYSWLTYNPGLMRIYHRYAKADGEAVAAALKNEFPDAPRWVDVGAGSGAFAAAAARAGRKVVAYERSVFGRWLGRAQGVTVGAFDLTASEPVRGGGGRFDLAYCFEVAEHVAPALGDRLVIFLSRLAPMIVFTAAPPGQRGAGHINEQPREYWIARFEREGMEYDAARSERLAMSFEERGVGAPWLIDNMMVFSA